MNLRDDQMVAFNACRASVVAGKRAPLVVAPTGFGKTVLLSAIAASHLSRGEGRSVAWTAPRRELVRQAAKTLERFGLTVGHGGINARAPIQVVTIQTCLARGEAPPGTLAIFDEAHHVIADEWRKLPELYAHTTIVGATATPERDDGKGLGLLFDDLIVAAQRSELIASGLLAGCDVLAPRVALGKKIAMDPADAYVRHAKGTSAVVFAPNMAACAEYRSQFIAKGIAAEVVSNSTRADVRARALENFDRGALPVLINIHVLTEGWDSPRAKTCILARRFGSTGAYDQAVGRVLRPWEGKRALLIDLPGTNVEQHGSPEENRVYSLDGLGIRRASDAVDAFCRIHQIPRDEDGRCPECGDRVTEMGAPEVAGVELDKWAAVRSLPGTKRVIMLAAFIRDGILKRHSPKAALFKYKAIFRQFPPAEVRAAAEASARRQIEEARRGRRAT